MLIDVTTQYQCSNQPTTHIKHLSIYAKIRLRFLADCISHRLLNNLLSMDFNNGIGFDCMQMNKTKTKISEFVDMKILYTHTPTHPHTYTTHTPTHKHKLA